MKELIYTVFDIVRNRLPFDKQKDSVVIENTKSVQSRDDFLKKGTELLKAEFENHANSAINIQRKYELKNIDILSSNLVANKNVSRKIRNQIKEYSGNLRKIIIATASYIEENNDGDIETKINELDLAVIDKNRVLNLIYSQKKMNLSFQSLSVLVDIFKKVNIVILNEIEKAESSNSKERFAKTKLYLKNAILIYELTNFLVEELDNFELQGAKEIVGIRNDLFRDIEMNRKRDQDLREKIANRKDNLAEKTIEDINNRHEVRNKIRIKWDMLMEEINEIQKKINKTKTFTNDLKLIRENAKNQIDVINLIAITQVVQNTLEAVGNLSDFENFRLAPLDGRKACELLGIDI